MGRAGPGDYLDSLAVDAAGRICVGSRGNGALLVFPPEGGAPSRLATPDMMTTNICFGGPDLRTAFVTLGGTGRIAAMDWDKPGLPLAF